MERCHQISPARTWPEHIKHICGSGDGDTRQWNGAHGDHSKMMAVLEQEKRKRKPSCSNTSFHEGRPRKSKVKCQTKLQSASSASVKRSEKDKSKTSSVTKDNIKEVTYKKDRKNLSKKGSNRDTNPFPHVSDKAKNKGDSENKSNPVHSPLAKLFAEEDKIQDLKVGSVEGSFLNEPSPVVTDVDDSESVDEELTEEDLKVLAKVAKRRRIEDIKDLISATSIRATASKEAKSNLIDKSNGKSEQQPESSNEDDSNLEGKEQTSSTKSNSSKSAVCEHQPESSNGDDSNLKGKDQTSSTKSNSSKSALSGEKKKVVLLAEHHNVFVAAKDLKKAKREARSAYGFARCLSRCVFSDEAMDTCSATGRPACGNGSNLVKLRPPLDQDGVDAIFDCVSSRAAKKGWGTVKMTVINKANSDLICERRYNKKLQAMARDNSDDESDESDKADQAGSVASNNLDSDSDSSVGTN
ncbi:hypothetical protein ONE63_011106 [Megalurothrips usitatus]|uniref:BEN domain-containing protein n=1 Tax=Megalurothrips usitatus TaxID=439358 RepID=A0AAV7XF27_9NEOP|nr:hypothetical protein ONE63_011106 [Megalurothrips usitatus]